MTLTRMENYAFVSFKVIGALLWLVYFKHGFGFLIKRGLKELNSSFNFFIHRVKRMLLSSKPQRRRRRKSQFSMLIFVCLQHNGRRFFTFCNPYIQQPRRYSTRFIKLPVYSHTQRK